MRKKEEFGCSAREEFWRGHVDSWRKSGLSQGKYARQTGISRWTLGYWKRKLERGQPLGIPHPLVIPVDLFPRHDVSKAPETYRGGAFRLHLGAYGLEIPPDFAAPALIRLLDCLERRL